MRPPSGFAVVVAVACALLPAGRAGAPPPLAPFPDVLLPDDGSTAPDNTRLWIFGDGAPRADQVGVAVSVGGVPVDVVVDALGGSGFVVVVDDVGAAALDVFVSSAAGERQATITLGGGDDGVAPALLVALLLDDSDDLVIGLEGQDDRGLAGFLARREGVVVGATAADRVLQVAGPCVDVSAVDLAGNESPATTVCAGAGEGEGENGGEGEGEGEGEGDVVGCPGCAGGGGFTAPVTLLALLFVRRRAR